MAIDPLIKKETDVIRNEQWADKVRSSIANGLDYMSEDVVEIDNRQKSLENDFVAVQQDARSNTPSGAELAVAAGEYNTLGERLDAEEQKVSAQLAQTINKVPFYEPITIEKSGNTHSSGYGYTAFGGGAAINGKEIYVMRSGIDHYTKEDAGFARLIAYMRTDDNGFETKIIDLDYSIREYRDPNLTLNSWGNQLLLTAVGYDGINYTNWLWVLDENLSILSTTQLTDMDTYFGFGNALYSPSGKLLKMGYKPDSTGGAYLFAQNTPSYNRVEVFPPSGGVPTEATIAYWGGKLVAVTRQNNGKMLYRQTRDLEGLTNWEPIITLSFKGDAPCLEPYIPAENPLIITASVGESKRDVKIIGTYDVINFTQLNTIALNTGRGGYNTFVKNNFGYGVMYFDDYVTSTELKFVDVQIDKVLPELAASKFRSELSSHRENIWESMVLQNGWVQSPSQYANKVGVMRTATSLKIRGQIESGTFANTTVIANVPSHLRIAKNTFATCVTGDGAVFTLFYNVNGDLSIYGVTKQVSLFIECMFIF